MSRQSKNPAPPPPPPPAGFTVPSSSEAFDMGLPSLTGAGLVFPTKLLVDLALARSAAEKAIEQQRDAERTAERIAAIKEDERRREVENHRLIAAQADRAKAAVKEQQPSTKSVKSTKSARSHPRTWRQVYTCEAVAGLLDRAKLLTSDKEIRRRDEELAKKLEGSGVHRQIAVPGTCDEAHRRITTTRTKMLTSSKPGKVGELLKEGSDHLKAMSRALEGLRLSHPHFSEVIDFVGQHQALASRSTQALGLPPILLNGEPGVGKTHFAFELTEVFGTTCRRVAFDTPITAATLMGSDKRWGNTQYGLLFELICLGKYANPVIVLDEIDKAGVQREWNPLAPLHTLLEPSTAVRIRDLSVDFEFDASQIIWIATSNNSRHLTSAIRSRFKEFDIERPDAAGALGSARAVVAKSFEGLNLVDFEAPGKDLAVAMAHLTAREITRALKVAVATAIQKGKRTVGPEDLPASVREDAEAAPGSSRARAGTSKPKTWLH